MLTLLLSASTAFPGDTKGNGGDILSCNASQILFHNISLDYYELIYIHQLQIPNDKYLNEIQIVEDKLELIKEKDLHRYLRMKSLLGTFYRDTKWINSPLADINDSGEVSLPIGCELLQIINQNKQLLSGTKKYIIRKDLWDNLDTINKSMLIMHELIYLDSKSITSENIRLYNILLFSEKITKYDPTSYFDFQNLLNFHSLSYKGVEIDMTKKIQFYKSNQFLIEKASPIEGSIFYFKNKEYKISYNDIHFFENGIPKEFCLFSKYTVYKNNQPFARAKKNVLTEENALTIMFLSDDLSENALPICKILTFKSVLLSSKGKKVDSLASLNGKIVGRIRNGCQKIASRKDLNLNLMDLTNANQGFELLKAKRIDFFCIVMDIVKLELHSNLNEKNNFEDPFVFTEENVWVIGSKNLAKSTVESLRKSCKLLKSEKYFERLSSKYIMQYYFY